MADPGEGHAPSFFLDQTEARKAEKVFFLTGNAHPKSQATTGNEAG